MKKGSPFLIGILFTASQLLAEVTVIFENPEDFTDIDFRYRGNKQGQQIYLPPLEKHIVNLGEKSLAEGQSLTITFTDIDLAGWHEPWHSPEFDDIRIVKSIYPPRMKFRYEITDAEGNAVREGEENLVDMAFDFRIRINDHDELFYEKAMIGDWLRKLNKR